MIAVAMLKKLGYHADVAVNGALAIEAILKNHYDAVLMDCDMPVMDGFEATRRIRALTTQARNTRIIAMTASALHEDQQHCQVAGMDDFLPKPVKLDVLNRTLDRWLPRAAEG